MENALQTLPIKRERISDQIKAVLKQAILDGQFKPGDKLPPEAEIAKAYDVSKVSAREALRDLEAEGLIQKKRGVFGGSFVAEPGSEKFVDVVANSYLFGGVTAEDLAEFRRLLEPGLARLAAEKRTDEDLEAMEACIQKIRRSIEKGAPDQTLAMGFHLLVAKACHNLFITSLMEALVSVFQQVLARIPDLETAKQDIRYNEAFYRHIKDRDGAKAEQVMKQHFDTLDQMVRGARDHSSNRMIEDTDGPRSQHP